VAVRVIPVATVMPVHVTAMHFIRRILPRLCSCHMTRHMNRQHQNNSNHSSLHSVATTPYPRPLLQFVLRLLWLELLLERWIQGYVALPQKSVLYSKFCTEFSMSLSIYRRVLSIGTRSLIHSLSPSHSPMRQLHRTVSRGTSQLEG